MWYDEKINKKIFLGGCFGAPNPFYFTILEGFWGPQNTPQKYFFLSYHIVWTLSFPGIPYFLFYNDFKRFYETFRKIGKNLGILYNKICPQIRFLGCPWGGFKNKLELQNFFGGLMYSEVMGKHQELLQNPIFSFSRTP